jgi:nicotinamidase-related amidase
VLRRSFLDPKQSAAAQEFRMPRSQTARGRQFAAALAGALLSGIFATAAQGQTILDTWKTVAIPPAPDLKPAEVDAAHSALLVLDINAEACTETVRPSCVRSIPHIQKLLADARAHKMLVIYSTSSSAPAAPVPAALARAPNDLIVVSSADKFVGTDLEKTLADRGIKTVIVTGTTGEGAVVYTASAAALRKLAVVVPVDGYSSGTQFGELVTAWLLRNAPVSVSSHVTLTRSDMITLR